MEVVEVFNDLPYELEIEVTTSESPRDNFNPSNSSNSNSSNGEGSSSNLDLNRNSVVVNNSKSLKSTPKSSAGPEIQKSHKNSNNSNVGKAVVTQITHLRRNYADQNCQNNNGGSVGGRLRTNPVSSPCSSSSSSIGSSPTPSSSSDSSSTSTTAHVGSGGIPVSTIQWASSKTVKSQLVEENLKKRKLHHQSERKKEQTQKTQRKVSPEKNGSRSRSRSSSGGAGAAAGAKAKTNAPQENPTNKVPEKKDEGRDGDDDDVVYIGEYRPLKKQPAVVPAPAQSSPKCPHCSCSCWGNPLMARKLSYNGMIMNNGSITTTPQRRRYTPIIQMWRNYAQQVSLMMRTRQYENRDYLRTGPSGHRTTMAGSSSSSSSSSNNNNSVGRSSRVPPALFPEPPESEWPTVRVYHKEPKRLGINLQSYAMNNNGNRKQGHF